MSVALYQQVHEALRSRIRSGEYMPGEMLPSEGKLVTEFGVSLITVRRAIHELALDGLVDSRQGLGHFVRSGLAEPVQIGMASFTSDVAEGRLRILRTLISDEVVQATAEIADKLNVKPLSMLRRLVRLDCTEGIPLSVDAAIIPPDLAITIDLETASSPVFVHLWQQKSGIQLVRTHYDIFVAAASDWDAHVLQVDLGSPVLVTEELLYDFSHRPAAWIESRYRADRCRLSGDVSLVRRQTSTGMVGE